MASKKMKPSWWQLYAMLPVLVGLFLLEMRLQLTGTENTLAQLGILGLVYGFMHLWLRANRRALMGLDEEHGEWRARVYEFPPVELPNADGARRRTGARPLLQVPDAGLKGVLSTTFEMDELEADTAFPAGSDITYREEVFNTSLLQRQPNAKDRKFAERDS